MRYNSSSNMCFLADSQKAFWNFLCMVGVDKSTRLESSPASTSLFVWQKLDRVVVEAGATRFLATFAGGIAGDWKNEDNTVCWRGFLCITWTNGHQLLNWNLHYNIYIYICKFVAASYLKHVLGLVVSPDWDKQMALFIVDACRPLKYIF